MVLDAKGGEWIGGLIFTFGPMDLSTILFVLSLMDVMNLLDAMMDVMNLCFGSL